MKRNSEFIGVDEQYIPEDEKYVDESILGNKEESKNKIKKAIKIGLGVWLIWGLLIIAFAVFMFVSIFNYSKKMNNQVLDLYNNGTEQILDLYDNVVEQMDDENQQDSTNKMDETQQNSINKMDEIENDMNSMINKFMNI